ncbi:MAG: hypothetical protein GY853_14755 [PVC group bacterium]|nr:hypothetical protein [PVC group bacterium]
MTTQPKAMASILPEWMIIHDFLGMPRTKSGKCRIVSSWIRQGLKHVEISGQRYFFEEDLLAFFWIKYKMKGD